MCGFISGLSIVIYVSDLCQYHTVLITVILWCSLKSKSLISPADNVIYRAEILNFNRVQLVNFCFLSWVMPLVLHLKCHFQTQSHLDFSPLLSSRGFMVLHFTFRSMIYFVCFLFWNFLVLVFFYNCNDKGILKNWFLSPENISLLIGPWKHGFHFTQCWRLLGPCSLLL